MDQDLEKALAFEMTVTIPDLKQEITKLKASNAGLTMRNTKLRSEIEELKERRLSDMLLWKQEEQSRNRWQARAEEAEAKC